MAENIRVLIEEEKVDKRIEEPGKKISEEYAGKEVHLICILKGSIFFTCELAKRITVPVYMDFMATGSYGSGTVSTGDVKIKKELDLDVTGKNVLVAEDIIDSGNTLSFLLKYFEDKGVKSIRLATMLDKPDRREVDVHVDYTGFTIPDEFVVGYGLDYDQKYRNLPYIGVMEFDD